MPLATKTSCALETRPPVRAHGSPGTLVSVEALWPPKRQSIARDVQYAERMPPPEVATMTNGIEARAPPPADAALRPARDSHALKAVSNETPGWVVAPADARIWPLP